MTNSNRDKLQAVAKILGWKFEKFADHGDRMTNGSMSIFVRYERTYKEVDKWSLFGSINRQNEIYLGQDFKDIKTSISLSSNKTSEQIARDITKRLLPNLSLIEAEVSLRLQKNDEYKQKCQSTLKIAAELTNTELRSDEESLRFSNEGFYGSVQASGDTARLDLRSLSIEAMAEVLKVLQKYSKS